MIYSAAEAKRWKGLSTNIAWCHFVWNWWVGCVKVGPECLHCYAEGWAKRSGKDVWGRHKPRPRTKTWGRVAKMRNLPRNPRWRAWAGLADDERPRCFVGSLMDWAEGRKDQRDIVAEAWPIIKAATEIDFLLLTKRPQNIPELLPADWGEGYPNVWMMTSCGDPKAMDGELQAPAIQRIPLLLKVPAVIHGVSYEPALGPLAEELRPFLHDYDCRSLGGHSYPGAPHHTSDCEFGCECWAGPYQSGGPIEIDAFGFCPKAPCTCGEPRERHVSWVVYGAESGAGHRPEGEPDDPKKWARDMRDVCAAAGCAFFHKQSSDRFSGRGEELDGRVIKEYPTSRGPRNAVDTPGKGSPGEVDEKRARR